MADTGYSHRYEIEAGNKFFEGDVEINGTYAASDEAPEGPTATEKAALTTLLTAVNTFKTTLGEVNSVKIWLKNAGNEGKKAGL